MPPQPFTTYVGTSPRSVRDGAGVGPSRRATDGGQAYASARAHLPRATRRGAPWQRRPVRIDPQGSLVPVDLPVDVIVVLEQ